MSAHRGDVLAWLDSLHVTDADGAVTNRKWPEAQEARAAVAGLIEACVECEAAMNEFPDEARIAAAFSRRRAALARCTGEGA